MASLSFLRPLPLHNLVNELIGASATPAEASARKAAVTRLSIRVTVATVATFTLGLVGVQNGVLRFAATCLLSQPAAMLGLSYTFAGRGIASLVAGASTRTLTTIAVGAFWSTLGLIHLHNYEAFTPELCRKIANKLGLSRGVAEALPTCRTGYLESGIRNYADRAAEVAAHKPAPGASPSKSGPTPPKEPTPPGLDQDGNPIGGGEQGGSLWEQEIDDLRETRKGAKKPSPVVVKASATAPATESIPPAAVLEDEPVVTEPPPAAAAAKQD